MKKTVLGIASIFSICLLLSGCNVKQDVPKIDGTFSSVNIENQIKEEEQEEKYTIKEGNQRLGKEIYGYLDLPVDWYAYFDSDITIDLLQYTDGNGKIVTIFPYRRAEVVGNAKKMREVFKETFSYTGATLIKEEDISQNDTTIYAAYFYYPETKSSAALFLIDEILENNIKDKEYVKYIFMESNEENDVKLFDTIRTYSLKGYNIATEKPLHTDKNSTQTIFEKEDDANKHSVENLVELQNTKTNFAVIPPKDYKVVTQDKFVANLTNDIYDVKLSFLDNSEVDYVRANALSKYHFYLAKYLDYSNAKITNDIIKINDDLVAGHYVVSYKYKELKQPHEYHYYSIPLEQGLYIIEVENHDNKDFSNFKINDFVNIL